MKFSIKGKGDIAINSTDFVTQGGEAKLYRKNKLIYKIYHNPTEMIPDGKIFELQEIKEPNVLIPKDIIYNDKGSRVGFTMDFIDRVIPLCKLFTNAFLNQNNVSQYTIIDLVKQMQATIHSIHSKKCIQVDGNELNYLVDEKDFKTCFFIDTNSYQTKSFPATVIMPSIRDWSSKTFNEMTDWYSFAIIACQLFIGIHPFKGKHQDFKRHDMEKRMKANVSIFNNSVTIPKSVRDFGYIPSNYIEWFINLFEKGKREKPPETSCKGIINIKYIVVKSTDNFEIKEISEFDDTIIDHYTLNGYSITRTKKSIHIESEKHRVGPGVHLIHTPKRLIPVLVKLEDKKVVMKSLDPKVDVTTGSEMIADDIFIVDDIIYLFHDGILNETRFMESTNVLLISKNIWGISKNSSQLFKNIIVQDLLGNKYISIPEPHPINSTLTTIRCAALDGFKVLDAKYENKTAVFSVYDSLNKTYGLIVLTGATSPDHRVRVINTNDYQEVNFTTLDNGIVILIHSDKLEIFSNLLASNKVKIIHDKEVSSNMSLCKRGASTRFFTDNKLYSIGMK